MWFYSLFTLNLSITQCLSRVETRAGVRMEGALELEPGLGMPRLMFGGFPQDLRTTDDDPSPLD